MLRYTLESKVRPKPSFVLLYFSSSKTLVLGCMNVTGGHILLVRFSRIEELTRLPVKSPPYLVLVDELAPPISLGAVSSDPIRCIEIYGSVECSVAAGAGKAVRRKDLSLRPVVSQEGTRMKRR